MNSHARVLILSLILLFLPCQARLLADINNQQTIRIGIETNEIFTTLRLQSFSGNWDMTFSPASAPLHFIGSAMASGTMSTATETEILTEGEDASLMLVPKGIIARLSTDKDLDRGFSKVLIEGGDLLSLEIPGHSPYLMQGRIEIRNNGTSLAIVNTINLHQFVVSSVSKMLFSNEPEVIKAVTIVVRTRLKYLKEHPVHPDTDYEICGSDHCLPYAGCGYNRELVDIIANMMKNQVLTYKDKIILPRFHHTCGGKISSALDIYGVDEPFHPAHDDLHEGKGTENCFHSPGFHWTVELQKFDILDFLSLAYAAGAERIFASWEPEKIDANGRIFQVLLRGRNPKSVSGIDFLTKLQSHFGPNSIKSMKFNMDVLKRTIIFRGMGHGDGVGMCIYGADGLAKKGIKYDEILKFYYPGTIVK